MACSLTEHCYGYESCRFEKDVDEHFHCSICYNVLKEPRTCRNNEHMFCLACINEHLRVNSKTCPECNEILSLDTLRRPRVVSNILSKLKIKCDYASRGCSEFVCVEELQTHVENCGFAPVLCSNEECRMVINQQDKVHHETEICEHKKVTSFDFGQIQTAVKSLAEILMEYSGKVEALDEKTKNYHVEIKDMLGKLEGNLAEINNRINEKVDTKNRHDEMKQDRKDDRENVNQVRNEVGNVREQLEAARKETNHAMEDVKEEMKDMKENVKAAKESLEDTTKQVKDVKENLCEVNKDINEVKIMMNQMLTKLNMLELPCKLSSPSVEMMNTPREDILIAGGLESSGKSTEIYSWEKDEWFEVLEMNEERKGASSLLCKDRLFVVGGYYSQTIETLDLNELLPLKWIKLSGELPYKCSDLQTVVCEQRVVYIGGMNYDANERSNVIGELRVQLSTPCIMKEMCRMHEPRQCHSAEIFEDKVVIMGGEKKDEGDVLDSVLEFDVKKRKCTEMPPLPHALTRMATVRWRDKAVLLGGIDQDDEVLNDVFMYDRKTGKSTPLPSMLEKRCGCCAVITGNTIVVMGGMNEGDEDLSSVEYFTMGCSRWEYLPAMNKARCGAIAHVLPSTRKYV